MTIITTKQLNAKQLQDLDNLSSLIEAADQGVPPLYRSLLEKPRDSEGSVLYYQDNQLVGFLAAFFFYETACEVALIVHPDYRRQNIAKKLLQTILPLLIEREMMQLIFSMTARFNDSWIASKGFTYRQSDYHMDRFDFNPIFISSPRLQIRQANFEDISDLCSIESACFTEIHSEPFMRYANLLCDPDYFIVVANFQGQNIGKAHLRWQEQEAQFFDIGILPKFQKRGFGGELIASCINFSLQKGKAKQALDVVATNEAALKIYLRHGFKITMHHDYWQITLPKLQAWMQNI